MSSSNDKTSRNDGRSCGSAFQQPIMTQRTPLLQSDISQLLLVAFQYHLMQLQYLWKILRGLIHFERKRRDDRCAIGAEGCSLVPPQPNRGSGAKCQFLTVFFWGGRGHSKTHSRTKNAQNRSYEYKFLGAHSWMS